MIPWGHAARLNDADNLDRQSQLLAGSPSHRESLDPGGMAVRTDSDDIT